MGIQAPVDPGYGKLRKVWPLNKLYLQVSNHSVLLSLFS